MGELRPSTSKVQDALELTLVAPNKHYGTIGLEDGSKMLDES